MFENFDNIILLSSLALLAFVGFGTVTSRIAIKKGLGMTILIMILSFWGFTTNSVVSSLTDADFESNGARIYLVLIVFTGFCAGVAWLTHRYLIRVKP